MSLIGTLAPSLGSSPLLVYCPTVRRLLCKGGHPMSCELFPPSRRCFLQVGPGLGPSRQSSNLPGDYAGLAAWLPTWGLLAGGGGGGDAAAPAAAGIGAEEQLRRLNITWRWFAVTKAR